MRKGLGGGRRKGVKDKVLLAEEPGKRVSDVKSYNWKSQNEVFVQPLRRNWGWCFMFLGQCCLGPLGVCGHLSRRVSGRFQLRAVIDVHVWQCTKFSEEQCSKNINTNWGFKNTALVNTPVTEKSYSIAVSQRYCNVILNISDISCINNYANIIK